MDRFIVSAGSGVSVGTGINTYSGLLTTIGEWLDRDDLADQIPNFIRLLEAKLNRELRCPEMEETVTLSTTAERIDLPTDFLKARSFYLDTDPRWELHQVSMGTLRTSYATQTTGKPEVFAISGSEIVFGPCPDDEYDAILTYYTRIEALSSDNESNWLSLYHPDIYLFGALTMAEAYLWEDDRIQLWKSGLEEALANLQDNANQHRYGASPLRLRPSVRE